MRVSEWPVRVGSERESLTGVSLVARQAVKSRQADLDKRRANLRRARQLLNDRRSSSPAMPHATATERTRQALIQRQHQAVQSRATDTRSILARELLAAYGFDQVHADQPLPSPFKSPTSSTSSLTSSISSSALDVLHISLPATGPTFTLGQVLLPPLSAFAALSPPHLSAVLSHILQLVRLLALYQDVALPFTPLPSLFGPGRPGVRAIPGHGEGVPSAAGPGLASWPLFLSRTSTRDSNEPSAIADYARVTGATATPPATQASGPQTGGRDTDLVAREAERRAVRLKAALTGAVALAYDLAWIAWTAGLALELKLEDLDNVGGLLSKISGLVGESGTAVECVFGLSAVQSQVSDGELISLATQTSTAHHFSSASASSFRDFSDRFQRCSCTVHESTDESPSARNGEREWRRRVGPRVAQHPCSSLV